MIRVLVAAVGGAAMVLAGLTGCSSEKKPESKGEATPAAPAATSPSVGAATGAGSVKVTIDGNAKDVEGQVACVTSGGTVNIGVGDQTTGIAVVMSEDASTVTSVALGNVDGVALGFAQGMPGGSATASKDGKTYTVSGTATGIDMANPTAPMTKPFEVVVSCP